MVFIMVSYQPRETFANPFPNLASQKGESSIPEHLYQSCVQCEWGISLTLLPKIFDDSMTSVYEENFVSKIIGDGFASDLHATSNFVSPREANHSEKAIFPASLLRGAQYSMYGEHFLYVSSH